MTGRKLTRRGCPGTHPGNPHFVVVLQNWFAAAPRGAVYGFANAPCTCDPGDFSVETCIDHASKRFPGSLGVSYLCLGRVSAWLRTRFDGLRKRARRVVRQAGMVLEDEEWLVEKRWIPEIAFRVGTLETSKISSGIIRNAFFIVF